MTAHSKTTIPTVAKLWSQYVEYLGERPTGKTLGYTGKRVLRYFGSKRAEEITIDHCRAYVERRYKDGVNQGTVHTELGHLSMTLKWGVKMGMIPFAPYIERPQKPQPKARRLSREEVRRLLDVEMAPHVRLAIILMLQTGARVGAVLDLTWDRVDLEEMVIDLRRDTVAPKKGRAVVPISEALARTLSHHKALRQGRCEYVVTWNGQRVLNIYRAVKAVTRKAGLRDVSPHVFRHTAAANLLKAGVPMSKIATFLGHSNESTTRKVYATWAAEDMRDAAYVLENQ